MNVARAVAADWNGVLALQEANLIDNLDAGQRAQGFLTVRFSLEQFERMNRDAAVAVAREGGQVAGYACSSTQAFNADVPIIATMMAGFPALWLGGQSLASPSTAIYGPVCVAPAHRGRGVFGALVRQLKIELQGRFDTAVGFVAKSNRHSLDAHVEGAGQSLLGDFEYAGRGYWIVAFAVPPEAVSCVL